MAFARQHEHSMTAETSRIKTKLSNLNALLSDLESQLDPILSKPLPETIVGLELIQQAKLQTVLPYLVYDLVFSESASLTAAYMLTRLLVYLKAKGTDPKTHAVVAELVGDHRPEYDTSINETRTECDNILIRSRR